MFAQLSRVDWGTEVLLNIKTPDRSFMSGVFMLYKLKFVDSAVCFGAYVIRQLALGLAL